MDAAGGLARPGAAVDLRQDIGEIALIPRTGGVFQITYDGELIWDRKEEGGFPDSKVLKQRVRDRLDPQRSLGHVDGHKAADPTQD